MLLDTRFREQPWNPELFQATPRLNSLLLAPLVCRQESAASLRRAKQRYWLEAPQQFHDRLAVVLSFLFGGSWTATISAFLGYLGLAAYGVGLIQFLVVRLPKQGRLAGGF